MQTPPILDVEFLRRQTAGDAALERELLGLLDEQCESLLPILTSPEDSTERRDAAHGLRGAAAALGALRLAATATAIELRRPPTIPIDEAVAELRGALRLLYVDEAA